MYKIMLLMGKRPNYKDLYRFYADANGVCIYDSLEELKVAIHELLHTYSKEEIVVVHQYNWDVLILQDGDDFANVSLEDIEDIFNVSESEVFGDE